MRWSKRVSFGAGIFGNSVIPLITSTILFNNNSASFYGEAHVFAGPGFNKYGFYSLHFNGDNGQITGSKIAYSPVARAYASYSNDLFQFQKLIAFPLANKNRSLVFREIFRTPSNEIVCNLINTLLDSSGNVTSTRLIERNTPYPSNYFSKLINGRPECTIDKNNTIAFFDRGVKPKIFAVVDNSNHTILCRSIGTGFSPDPEINNIDFINNSQAVSLHVTDSASTIASQQLDISLYGTDTLARCLGSDTSFFSLSPITITGAALSIDSTRDDIFSARNLAVDISPFSFQRLELCKTISTCSKLKIAGDSNMCMNDTYELKVIKNAGCYQKTHWEIDTSQFNILAFTDTSVSIIPRHTGNGLINVSLGSCNLKDSLHVSVYNRVIPFSLGNDTTLCGNQSLTLQLPPGYKKYLWSNGDTTQQLATMAAGLYWGEVSDDCGQLYADTIFITNAPALSFSLGPDTSLCQGKTLVLNAGNSLLHYLWNTGSAMPVITVSTAGVFWVKIIDSNHCQAIDTIIIKKIYNLPAVSLDKNPIRCVGQTTLLDAGYGFTKYLWQDGSSTQAYLLQLPGTYWVTVTDLYGCSNIDTVKIERIYNAPSHFITGDTVLCILDNGVLRSTQPFVKYIWSNFQLSPAISITSNGNYWLSVVDINGCTGTDTINVKQVNCQNKIYFPTAFTPNNDGLNDNFKPIVFGVLSYYSLSVYNRFGQKIFETSQPANGWNGKIDNLIQQSGGFVWICSYQFRQEKEKNEKGNLLLIR